MAKATKNKALKVSPESGYSNPKAKRRAAILAGKAGAAITKGGKGGKSGGKKGK